MGAISAASSIPVLRQYTTHADRDVRETCEIALAKIEWDHSEEGKVHRKTEEEKAEEGVQCVRFMHPTFAHAQSHNNNFHGCQNIHIH